MAATGYTPVFIFSSSTGGNTPAAGNLTNTTLGSELAVNIADGKLFYKNTSNVVSQFGMIFGSTAYGLGSTISDISNVTIGGVTPAAATFTGITINNTAGDNLTLNGNTANGFGQKTTNSNSGTYFTLESNGGTGSSVTDWAKSAVLEAVPASGGNLVLGSYSGSVVIQTGARGQSSRFFSSGGVSIGNTTDPGAANLSVKGITTGSATSLGFGTNNSTNKLILDTNNNLTLNCSPLSGFGTDQFRSNGLISVQSTNAPTTSAGGITAFGGSTGSPNAGNVYFGDGSGWQWKWNSVNSSGTITNRFYYTDGGAAYSTTGTWGTISDERAKENIEKARDGYLKDLMKLEVVKYSLKSDNLDKANFIGLIAQQVETVFPGLVQQPHEDDVDGFKSVKTSVLTYMLLKAIQEQQARIEKLETKVTALQSA